GACHILYRRLSREQGLILPLLALGSFLTTGFLGSTCPVLANPWSWPGCAGKHQITCWSIFPMNSPVLKDTLIGEEWKWLRQIARGTQAPAVPRSVRARLEDMGVVARDEYRLLVLTEKGRRLLTTAN